MNFKEYQKAYFSDPIPEPGFRFSGSFGVTLFFEEFDSAVKYYQQILGPPAYVLRYTPSGATQVKWWGEARFVKLEYTEYQLLITENLNPAAGVLRKMQSFAKLIR